MATRGGLSAAMIRVNAPIPPPLGIEMSKSTTSGRSRNATSAASSPSLASPTTSRPSASPRLRARPLR